MLEQNFSTEEIAQQIGCCKDVVRLVARKYGLTITKKKKDCMHDEQPLNQYDKQGNYIQSFDSRAAARWLEDNGYVNGSLSGVRGHIGDVCKGKRKTAYTFIWKNKTI